MKRRSILKLAPSLGLLPLAITNYKEKSFPENTASLNLDSVFNKPIINQSHLSDPIIIDSIKLLKNGENFIVQVRSKDGAEGFAISHNTHIQFLYPILIHKIAPHFIGKDARKLEFIIEEAYVKGSNYKWQGLPFWVPMASVEFAVLDLLGKVVNQPVGALFGKVYRSEIAVYRANNYRGKTAEESMERILENVERSGAKAIKYKVGGRMSKNQDYPTGRTEKLIPLVRKTLGDEITIYADSNGSYDVENSIRVGRMLEETNVSFFEEPCPFDHIQETLQIADALTIPIAGGEQDSSLYSLKWMIENQALQVVQPDLFYFGGMIRSMKVALMAHEAGLICTPHISGTGLGYLYMLHFVSALPNAGPYHEFKGLNKKLNFTCETSDLRSDDGVIKVPTGPGLGITLDSDLIKKAVVVE